MMKLLSFGLILILLLTSCSHDEPYFKQIHTDHGWVCIEYHEKISRYSVVSYDSLTRMKDRIFTPYDIFHAELGDVNANGKTDILLGIIKPTPFDSAYRKRLFIFEIDRGYIRPLWLSSKLINPLEDFFISDQRAKQTVITLEKQSESLFAIREYQWDSFGLYLFKELADSMKYKKACTAFNRYKSSKIYHHE